MTWEWHSVRMQEALHLLTCDLFKSTSTWLNDAPSAVQYKSAERPCLGVRVHLPQVGQGAVPVLQWTNLDFSTYKKTFQNMIHQKNLNLKFSVFSTFEPIMEDKL